MLLLMPVPWSVGESKLTRIEAASLVKRALTSRGGGGSSSVSRMVRRFPVGYTTSYSWLLGPERVTFTASWPDWRVHIRAKVDSKAIELD